MEGKNHSMNNKKSLVKSNLPETFCYSLENELTVNKGEVFARRMN